MKTLVKILAVGLVAMPLIWSPKISDAGEDWETIRQRTKQNWADTVASSKKKWEKTVAVTEAQWDAVVEAERQKWETYKAEVEQKWQQFVHSTKTDWVDYDQNRQARVKVDFKQGEITLEAVVSPDAPHAEELAWNRIRAQAETMFRQKDIDGKAILQDQLADDRGRPVAAQDAPRYLEEKIRPTVKPEPEPYKANDGQVRRRYTVTVPLVRDHLARRAAKYAPIVARHAGRFNLKPELVMAVIHTESSFNPRSLSPCEAVGMMQIIPRFAGREAYQLVYDKDELISQEYLFDPEQNIELGCAYLSILKTRHFRDIDGEVKNRYVSICGYNWGPTAMRKNILRYHNLNAMSDQKVYVLLRNNTPEETSNYIKRVTERMPKYASYFK